MASIRASSSENEVNIKHRSSGLEVRSSRHTSMPDPSGSRTSSTATSGRVAGTLASASATVAGLPDHFQIASRLEEISDTTTNDLVVVEEEHPNHLQLLVRLDRLPAGEQYRLVPASAAVDPAEGHRRT